MNLKLTKQRRRGGDFLCYGRCGGEPGPEDNALRVCLRVFGAVVSRNGTTLSICSRVSVPPRPSPSCLHHFYLHRRPVLLPFPAPRLSLTPPPSLSPSSRLSRSPYDACIPSFSSTGGSPSVSFQLLMKILNARIRPLLTQIVHIYSFFRRRQRSHMQCGSVELELCAESCALEHR